MKLTPWYLAALAPIAVAGCSGALAGHMAVLVLAIGIFVGTLSLGRHQPVAITPADAANGHPAIAPVAAQVLPAASPVVAPVAARVETAA